MLLTETRETTDKSGNRLFFRAGRNNGYLFAWAAPDAATIESAPLYDSCYELDLAQFDPDAYWYYADDDALLEALEQWIKDSPKMPALNVPISEIIKAALADPSTSNWLKAAIRELLQRDPVDAVKDAQLLHELFEAQLLELLPD